MKKIIVTGGSGFIGSNLVNYLVKKNYFDYRQINLFFKYISNQNLTKKLQISKIDINNKSKLFM